MQTLKTAAIVVLLMTVMYGAYVSLTTPPEPLPADVEDMLVINEEGTLTIDTGLPESLGTLEINSGSPSTPSADATDLAALDLPAESSFPAEPTTMEGIEVAGANEVASASLESGVTTTLSDAATLPLGATDLSQRGDAVAEAVDSGTARTYPRTNNTFELPDPSSVRSTFDLSQKADGPSPQSNLALTSGTESQSFDAPPTTSGVSQISAHDSTHGNNTPNLGLANAIRTADKLYRDDRRKEAWQP